MVVQRSSQDRDRSHSPWLAIAGVFGIYFAFGMTLGVMAPMVDEISADLELSRSAMGSVLGAWALIYVFTAVPAGAVVDRLGLRLSLLLGGFSIAVSLFLRSAASGMPSLFGAVAVFGIGGPLVSIATPKLVATLFVEDARRLPTGLAVSAPAAGSAVGLALTNPVLLPLTNNSWRGVLVLVGIVAVAATAFWTFASRAVPAHRAGATQTNSATLARLLRLTSMRRILLISLFSFFFSHGLSTWLPEILTDTGQTDNAAGYLAAISTLCGIAGALLIARLVPIHKRASGLVGVFVTLALGVGLLGTLPFGALFVVLAVIGFVRAGVIPLLFLEIMGDTDIQLSDIGAATGLFFAVGEIGGFTGPYAMGFVADQTNGFGAATALLAGVAAVAALGAGSLARLRAAVPH